MVGDEVGGDLEAAETLVLTLCNNQGLCMCWVGASLYSKRIPLVVFSRRMVRPDGNLLRSPNR